MFVGHCGSGQPVLGRVGCCGAGVWSDGHARANPAEGCVCRSAAKRVLFPAAVPVEWQEQAEVSGVGVCWSPVYACAEREEWEGVVPTCLSDCVTRVAPFPQTSFPLFSLL